MRLLNCIAMSLFIASDLRSGIRELKTHFRAILPNIFLNRNFKNEFHPHFPLLHVVWIFGKIVKLEVTKAIHPNWVSKSEMRMSLH